MAAKNKIEIILQAVDRGVQGAFAKVNASLAAVDQNTRRYGRSMALLQAPIKAATGAAMRLGVALGGTFAVGKYLQVADEYTNINARLKLVTGSSQELATAQKDLYALSQETGTSYAANAGTYHKLAVALKDAGVKHTELIGINEAVSKSLIVNGSSAEMASSFLLQFGQAMGSGVLQGDEFRAMMESNSYFAQQLARALDTDIAGLRQMSKDGKLTTDVIRGAVPKMLQEIDRAFAKMPLTIGRAMTMVGNAFGKLVNGSNEASGATGKIAEAIRRFVSYLEDNGAAIEDYVVKIVDMAGAIIKAAWEYKGLIGAILGGSLAVGAIASLTTAITGLNVALTVLTGQGIILWLKGLTQAFVVFGQGIALIPGVVTTLALALAGLTGWGIGSFLNKFDVVKQAGIAMASGLTLAWLRTKLAWATLTGGDTAAIEQEIAEAERIYAEMFGEIQNGAQQTATVQVQEQQKAVDGAKAAAAEQKQQDGGLTAYAQANAAKRQQVQGAALEAMKKKYQEYAAEVRRLQDEIKNRELSLYDQLRTMARTGMSGVDAWQDLQRQAQEYEKAATDAAAAGDFKTAIDYADKARELYAQLNTEVKEGDTVLVGQQEALKTAMDGVQRAGQIGVDALTAMQTKAAQNMDELVEQSGFQDLTEGMNEAEKQWLDNWSKMKAGALKEVAAVERKIVELTKDRYVTVYVKEVVKKATGGLIQRFARGGKLAGYGGGDRISALLEAGEFVVRKEAVAKFGTGMFVALNSLRMPDIPRFAVGGLVGGGAGPSGDTININLSLPGGGAAVRVSADRQSAAELLRQVQRLQRLSA